MAIPMTQSNAPTDAYSISWNDQPTPEPGQTVVALVGFPHAMSFSDVQVPCFWQPAIASTGPDHYLGWTWLVTDSEPREHTISAAVAFDWYSLIAVEAL